MLVNFENNSNIVVKRDGSIMCQQNSKEHEKKKLNNHNHQTNNLTGNRKADKNNWCQYQENKILQFEQALQKQKYTSDSNGTRTHNHLVCRWTLSLAKWLSVRLQTKWLWVPVPLLFCYPACF